ncbi:MAG: hypothetical protein ACKVQA_21810 [Burkholderiales bacterium]
MRIVQKFLFLAALLLVGACSAPGEKSPPGQSIEIREANGNLSLSVPVSRLTMTMPKSNWSRKDKSALGGGTKNPRYFYFEDKTQASLIMSGWFEPAQLFKGVPAIWEEDTKSWKKGGLPEPVNISFEKLNGWDAVMYDHNLRNAVSSHVRAHWVRSGTWIDVHISTTTNKSSAENRAKLKAVLKDIAVVEKGRG